MSEIDSYTLNEAWKAAWKAEPLAEYPVSGADLAAFKYGRDCATAAVKALRDIHPIRERRKHERKVRDAIAAASVGRNAERQDNVDWLGPKDEHAVGVAETPSPSHRSTGE